jgi:hypothetical protein
LKKLAAKPDNKFNFWLLASLVFVTWGLLLAAYSPQITAWRSRIVDKIVSESAQVNTSQKLSYLKAANTLAPNDPVSIEALANYYRKQGSEQALLNLYERKVAQPNQIYLGKLALSLQQYDSALQHFYLAEREQPSAASLGGESAVMFNLNRIDEGCDRAIQAQKLDLSNKQAEAMVNICNLLKTNPDSGSRTDANLLLQYQIAKVGEKWLLADDGKTPNDWLNLAELAAARGDIKTAASRAEEGIKLDHANLALNKALAKYYEWLGDDVNYKKYQQRTQQLEFSAWQ